MITDFTTPTIETPRLVLRKITLDDTGDIFDYGRMPEVSRFCIWETHTSDEDAKAYIRSAIAKYENNEPSDWGIFLKSENKLIGAIGYVFVSHRNFSCEVGYAISKNHWGQGITTEALKAVINHLFNDMGFHRVEARCYFENAGSYRVMEKAGMIYEGTAIDQMYVKGSFWTMRQYAIVNNK
jgi:ribosomal-protein-alanine N-acetyltransferase